MHEQLRQAMQALTPVTTVGGLYVKRDDLFRPFSGAGINGGKVRQCLSLVLDTLSQRRIRRILTGCSIRSPQAVIAAVIAKRLGLECRFYCCTSHVDRGRLLQWARANGAEVILCPSGRSSVLYHRIGLDACETDLVVRYGMRPTDQSHVFFGTTADQVRNLPQPLDNLVIPCGSGITLSGVLYGIARQRLRVGRVWAVGVAPNRERTVAEYLGELARQTGVDGRSVPLTYCDMFNEAKGFKYENTYQYELAPKFRLHCRYEAKAYRWYCAAKSRLVGQALLWIVGGPIVDWE
jgi:1-aminocyclopropane-1-carboxylate deaminase/D-cysteine desulfhydrase-like pyridoxal-dependent ACC family enzyme